MHIYVFIACNVKVIHWQNQRRASLHFTCQTNWRSSMPRGQHRSRLTMLRRPTLLRGQHCPETLLNFALVCMPCLTFSWLHLLVGVRALSCVVQVRSNIGSDVHSCRGLLRKLYSRVIRSWNKKARRQAHIPHTPILKVRVLGFREGRSCTPKRRTSLQEQTIHTSPGSCPSINKNQIIHT